MRSVLFTAILSSLPLTMTPAVDDGSALGDYARLVADLSVAQRRCSFRADWKTVAVEGHSRGIDGKDIAQLDRLVSERTAIIEASLSDDAALSEWCNDAILGYGPDGLEIRGLLKP